MEAVLDMKYDEDVMKSDTILDQVYKSCEKNWIVYLQPIEGTITNVGRDNVVDPKYAKFRGNKFMVAKIEHKYDVNLTTKSVVSSGYRQKSLTYHLGEMVAVEDYNMNKNIICTTGIHFFLTREAAFSYEKPIGKYLKQLSGPYTTYHDNGVKRSETTYENGKLHGPYVSYHANGNKHAELTYEKGEPHGSYHEYHDNGNKHIEAAYENGKPHGPYVSYDVNSNKSSESTYKNGHLHGDRIVYCRDNITSSKYENGKEIGSSTSKSRYR
jgi:antitoxin component YwqK of YwqJK toxin-antitoxin module